MRFGIEKLRTIKTARFCGKGLFGYKPEWFMFKKLLNDKIFIFWRLGVIWMPPEGGASKKLFGTKTLVLVSKWFSTPTRGLGLKNC